MNTCEALPEAGGLWESQQMSVGGSSSKLTFKRKCALGTAQL